MYVATLALIVVFVQARTQGARAGGYIGEEGGGVRMNRTQLHVAVALLCFAACMYFDCRCTHPASQDGIDKKLRQPWS